MPWLIAFIVAHTMEIAAIGVVASTISSIESAVAEGVKVVKVVKDDTKKED